MLHVDPSSLDGSTLALLLISEAASGEDDWAVFTGVFRLRNGAALLERGPGKPAVELQLEWLERIKTTNETTRSILLDAAYYLPLRVGDIPEHADRSAFQAIGLKWPER